MFTYKVLPALGTIIFGLMLQASLSGQSVAAREGPAAIAFRDAVAPPPKAVRTPVFKLSHDYPRSAPASCDECLWLKIPVNFGAKFSPGREEAESPKWHGQHWDEYIKAILDYVRQGQDPQLSNDVGWKVNVNGKTRWFNVPWMAYDPTAGREYVHGTTNERTAELGDFLKTGRQVPHMQFFMAAEKDSCKTEYPWGFESWSVGYYNEFGGYALGRAVPVSGIPQVGEYLGSPVPAGLPFPEGTVVVKILTSNIPVDCVPFLHGSPEWMVDRHKYTKANGYECDREVQSDRVVQVDVAVVDQRSPTRWVYGTFAYDGDTSGDTFWDHLVPVGLQWGSDPWTFPAVPLSGSLPLQQSVINTDLATFQHLGCKDRLAGPVDNPQSSCTSCHASAYAAPRGAPGIMGLNVPPSFGFDGMCQVYSLENSAYFQNQTAPQRFPGGLYGDAVTMDTSLQLEVAFSQYGYYNTDHKPQACTDPNQITPPHKAAEFVMQKRMIQ